MIMMAMGANDLPDDYPVNGTLIEDNDDDNDGIPDEYETGTGGVCEWN